MYKKELKILKQAVISAYKKCIQNKTKKVTTKTNSIFAVDIVTDCDLNTEKYIINQIKKHFPNDNFLSEEYNSTSNAKGRCWIIDPIDGTVNFANNIPIWCIQTAFMVDGECKLSVIYIPTQNELFIASEDGVTLNDKVITPSTAKEISNAFITFGDLTSKKKNLLDYQISLIHNLSKKCAKVRILGSSGYEFCNVASGKTDGYVIATNNVWDNLPGSFLCQKLGYKTTLFTIFNTNITIACSSSELMDLILKTSKKVLKNQDL